MIGIKRIIIGMHCCSALSFFRPPDCLQTAKTGPTWPSLFRRRSTPAPPQRPAGSAASVCLKPVLAAPHSTRRVRSQVQLLSPEKASHARAVAERAVEHVQNLLANRHAGCSSGGSKQVIHPLLARMELRASGLGAESPLQGSPLQGRSSIPRSLGAAGEVGMGVDIAAPRRMHGDAGHQVPACDQDSTVRANVAAHELGRCDRVAGFGEQTPDDVVGVSSARSLTDPYEACLTPPGLDGSTVEVVVLPEQGEIGGASCSSGDRVLMCSMGNPTVSERGGGAVSPAKRSVRVPGACAGIAHYTNVYLSCRLGILPMSLSMERMNKLSCHNPVTTLCAALTCLDLLRLHAPISP